VRTLSAWVVASSCEWQTNGRWDRLGGGGWGRKACGIKKGGYVGTSAGRALIGTTSARSAAKGA
jgi:hypothetical protein